MRTTRSFRSPWLALAVAAALSGCEKENSLPDAQITVDILSDALSWSVADLDNVTDGKRYLFSVTGPQVTVDVTESISDGSAFLQIRDGVGAIVYAEDVGDAADGNSDVGAQGLWQVDIVLSKVSGSFSFGIVRAP